MWRLWGIRVGIALLESDAEKYWIFDGISQMPEGRYHPDLQEKSKRERQFSDKKKVNKELGFCYRARHNLGSEDPGRKDCDCGAGTNLRLQNNTALVLVMRGLDPYCKE